jgi:hypothetical protein
MKRVYRKSWGIAALVACAQVTFGQAAYDPDCWPPMSTTGPSTDYLVYKLTDDPIFIAGPQTNNGLFGMSLGISGSDTYDKSCVGPNGATFTSIGRFGFTVGSIGSVQSEADNFLRISYGMPYMAGGSIGYAMLITQAVGATAITKTRFGSGGVRLAFVGASDRYCLLESDTNGFRIRLQCDVIGDAARQNWRMTNIGTDPVNAGLWIGGSLDFLDANGIPAGPTFVTTPGSRAITTPRRWRRGATGLGTDVDGITVLPMPQSLNFGISQEFAYGMQVVTEPVLVNGVPNSDQTPVDELAYGNETFGAPNNGLVGGFANNDATLPDELISTDVIVGNPAWLQKWDPVVVTAGATREINAYFKSTWSNADYSRPFSVVCDAPNVIATSTTDPGALTPNPYTFRVYVDNTRGYSTIDREVTLNNVRVELQLPPGMSDASDPTRTTIVRTISSIAPRTIGFVDFTVRVDESANGFLPYTVRVNAPTGASKVIPGRINVASTPRLTLPSTANLVASPWTYQSSSWESVLGLQVNQDFRAFTYDPQQGEYVIQTSPVRGRGTWLITDNVLGTVVLGGTPSEPTDTTSIEGAPGITLQPGWNLVANPYNFAISLGSLNGVSAANPGSVLTFLELAAADLIGGALAFYDTSSPTPEYRFLSQGTDQILPNRGYWIFVNTQQQLTLFFPPVTEPFIPSRGNAFTQSEKQWRLQLAARNDEMLDSQNFVGLAKDAASAKRLVAQEPPVAPVKSAISLSVKESGGTQKYASMFTDKLAKHSWEIEVNSRVAGPVTLTWPNLQSVPKNVQFRLVDPSTGRTVNVRRTSGYTFQAEARVNRRFTLEMEPGVAARPVIGLITATRSSKLANAPLTINYTLAADATTTVRILSGGREVFVPARARADRRGQNTIVWNLRDSANRVVAPGAYTVEITAESDSGERVRSFYPINIIR